jgi:tRNA threonylcarbamoyladenosine biosynthesis protein TsaE
MLLIQVENSHTKLLELPAIIISGSEDETVTLGKRFASLLEKGNVVALRGPLGAGKTCFTKGIALALGITEGITSPTYTIVSEYEVFSRETASQCMIFYHIDAYRLRGNDDFSAIGGEDIVFGSGISVIEWSERIPDFIDESAYKVDFEILEENKRCIRIYRGENEHSGN